MGLFCFTNHCKNIQNLSEKKIIIMIVKKISKPSKCMQVDDTSCSLDLVFPAMVINNLIISLFYENSD